MLERVTLHHARLVAPGLRLDQHGVAVGPRALLVVADLELLVRALAALSRASGLELSPADLELSVLRSPLGVRELALGLPVRGARDLDALASIARLLGGLLFTGADRHFVAYRDASAPFGYDVRSLVEGDAPVALYHPSFCQGYARERRLSPRGLALRLPLTRRRASRSPAPWWLLARPGVARAVAALLTEHGLTGTAALVDVPRAASATPLEVAPPDLLVRVDALPARLLAALRGTPGLALLRDAGPGAAVQAGYEHPLDLGGLPLFGQGGLTLFLADAAPLELAEPPALVSLSALASLRVDRSRSPRPAAARAPAAFEPLTLRVEPHPDRRRIAASWVPLADLPLLRRLLPLLDAATLQGLRVTFTGRGAVLLGSGDLAFLPLGEPYVELCPGLHLVAGHALTPRVAPERVLASYRAPAGSLLFIDRLGRCAGLPGSAFVPLEQALLGPEAWTALEAAAPAEALHRWGGVR